MDFDDDLQVQLMPCSYCGRNFAAENLSRHQNICQKTSRKRPVFDSSKQRIINADDANYRSKKQKTLTNKTKSNFFKASNPTGWRQKHEEFIQTVRAARVATVAIKEGKKLPPPPPPTINPDYIQCPHCLRRFNQTAAERHINFCAEQAKRLPNKKPVSGNISTQAAMRASARQKYCAPLPQSSKKKSEISTRGLSFDPTTHNGTDNRKKATSARSSRPNQPIKTKSKTINADWDSSIDCNVGFSEIRTKTGLRPSSGLNDTSINKTNGRQPFSNINTKSSPNVRKVASKRVVFSGKNSVHSHSNTREHPRHDWSPESSNDRSDEDFPYTASMYQSSNANRYQLMNGPKKSTASKNFNASHYQSGSNKQSLPSNENNITNGYTNKFDGNLMKEADFYHWSEPAAEVSKMMSSINQKLNNSKVSSKFCHECGSRFPVTNAKFCCECGIRRIVFN